MNDFSLSIPPYILEESCHFFQIFWKNRQFFQIFWKNHVNSSKYFGSILSVLPNSLITLETHINVHLHDSLSLSPIEAQCHCPQSRLIVIVPNRGSMSLSPIEAQCHYFPTSISSQSPNSNLSLSCYRHFDSHRTSYWHHCPRLDQQSSLSYGSLSTLHA